MIRRLLLVAVVLSCRTSDSAPQAKPAPPAKPMPDTSSTRITQVTPQRTPSRLVVAGTRIGWLGNEQLVLTDTATKHATTVPIAGARSIGVLGSDIAVGTISGATTALVRFAPGDVKGVRASGLLTVPAQGTGRIAAGAKPTELYMTAPRELARLRVDPDRIMPVHIEPWRIDELRTFVPLDGGRVAFVGVGALVVVMGADDHRAEFALHDRWSVATHIAAGPTADTLWITVGNELALARLKPGTAEVGTPIKLDATAYHLASAGDFAAVLTAQGAGKLVGEVVVVGGDGAVRWRAKLPQSDRLNAYIAASPEVVAVQLGDDQLFAWRAKDGKALLP